MAKNGGAMNSPDGDPKKFPRIFFLNDFPPFASSAGALLIERLFAGLPSESIHVVYSSACRYRLTDANPHGYGFDILAELNPTGRWGWGRCKGLINYLLIAFNTAKALSLFKQHPADVIVTVAHQRLCLVACLLALMLRKPLVIIVHDDWALLSSQGSLFPSYQAHLRLFGWMLRRGKHVYAVSEAMGNWIEKKFGVISTPQYPSADVKPIKEFSKFAVSKPKLVYTGNYGDGNSDCLELLMEGLKKMSSLDALSGWSLHLYTDIDTKLKEKLQKKWPESYIHFHGWINQIEMANVLAEADILVLPYSFREDQREFASKSFPTKTVDYLNAGKPMLIIAPEYSALNQYAKKYGFGEIVEIAGPDAVVAALKNIYKDAKQYNEKMEKARKALLANHEIKKQRADFVRTLWECIRKD